MNKQGTLFFWDILLFHKRHHNSCYRALVALFEVMRMFSSKNPDDNPEALACFLFILYCMSQVVVMSLNDIRIICFHFSVGKALCMCRRAVLICLCTCQHPHQLLSTTMHEPCHHFCILNSEPVTLSPRYFGSSSYQSLKFIIKIICTAD